MMNFVLPLLLLVITLFVFIAKVTRLSIRVRFKWSYFVIYLAILILISPIFFAIQPKLKGNTEKIEHPPYMSEAAANADWNELLKPYKKEEWDVAFTDHSLKLQIADYEEEILDLPITVIFIKDKLDEEKTKIELYETPTVLNGVDISEKIRIAEIDIKESTLNVRSVVDYQSTQFYSVQQDMTNYQFKDDSMLDIYHDLQIGEIALVVYASANTKLIYDENYFFVIRH